MIDYNGQLDVLFKEWEAASMANGDDVISKDGLMKMKDVDVNEMWDKSPVRVMFLLKDQPNSGGDDIEILNPNIIVCCGGPQHHFVLHSLYNIETLETIDGNVHYDREKNVVVVYSPHPRAHCSHDKFFEGAMWHYGIFLKRYPGWPDINMTSCPGL